MLVLAGGLALGCGSGPAEAPRAAPPPVAPSRAAPRVTAAPDPDSTLAAELAGIARATDGALGAAVVHVESGRQAEWSGDRALPMASVYKLPIAVAVLERVDRGWIARSDSVTVVLGDVAPFHSPLAAAMAGRSVTVTVDSLLRLTISESDNTASDVLLRLAGGPAAVTARMRALGLTEIDVSRSEKELGRDAGRPGHLEDPRDAATPLALAGLLAWIARGEGLTPASRGLLLHRMTDTRTGPRRIVAGLPAGVAVAHKTGTMRDVTNDVGLVRLPDGSHLAVAVLTTGPPGGERSREDAIAAIARAAWHRFTPPASAGP